MSSIHVRDFLMWPAVRGPWGVVTATGGPPDLPRIRPRPDLIRTTGAMLRTAGVLLSRNETPERRAAAGETAWMAYDLLVNNWDGPHSFTAYALDRLGVIAHLDGDLERAEECYRASLAVHDTGEWDLTPWAELTVLNLAGLCNATMRREQADELLARLPENRQRPARCPAQWLHRDVALLIARQHLQGSRFTVDEERAEFAIEVGHRLPGTFDRPPRLGPGWVMPLRALTPGRRCLLVIPQGTLRPQVLPDDD